MKVHVELELPSDELGKLYMSERVNSEILAAECEAIKLERPDLAGPCERIQAALRAPRRGSKSGRGKG